MKKKNKRIKDQKHYAYVHLIWGEYSFIFNLVISLAE